MSIYHLVSADIQLILALQVLAARGQERERPGRVVAGGQVERWEALIVGEGGAAGGRAAAEAVGDFEGVARKGEQRLGLRG